METKEMKPIIKIYVETPIKLGKGDLFAVDDIHERDGKYLGYTQTKTIEITSDSTQSVNFELTKGEKKK